MFDASVGVDECRFSSSQSSVGGRIKRVFDVVVASAMILVLAPLLAALSLAIMVTDGAPVIFRHTRIGHGGRRFQVFKFRTMRRDADACLRELLARDPEARRSWSVDQKLKDDPRILGAVGRFLRRTSLDELPQLFNVLRGEMSIVGPRPIVDDEVPRYGVDFSAYLAVRPGITGPWQVSGRNDIGYDTRVALDREYVENWSMWCDLKIMVRTALVMLTGRGAY